MSTSPRPTPNVPPHAPARVDVNGETELANEGISAVTAALEQRGAIAPLASAPAAAGPQPGAASPPAPPPPAAQPAAVQPAVVQPAVVQPAAQPADLRPSALASAALVGQVVDGRYQLDKVIGEGGMGVVFAGRHKIIGKPIAVKVLRQELARDREIIERFVLEARTASSIGNPHIVDISDFGTLPDGSTYFVMEYLEGENLMSVIDQGRLPLARVYPIALQICEALGAAHDRNIVHRDLKPDNIILVKRSGADFVKVLDFGIAKVSTDSPERITRAGTVFGTPHYMSPEQAAGRPVDRRADIYALGVMMYEMVAGQLPFDGGEGFMGILTMHMYKAPVPIRAVIGGEGCPPALEAIVQKCLSKRPENRYETMHALREDLLRASRGEPSHAMHEFLAGSGASKVPLDYFKPTPPEPGVPVVVTPPAKRSMALFVGLGIAVAVMVVAGIMVFGKRTPLADAEVTPPPSAEVTTRATSGAAATSAEATAPPSPIYMITRFELTPKTAVITVDGAKLDGDSLPIQGGNSRKVEISAPGYETQTLDVQAMDQVLKIELKPRRGAPPVVRPGAPPTAKAGQSGDSNLSVKGWE